MQRWAAGPRVPGCCCSIPGGADVVGIIEIVLSILSIASGLYAVIIGISMRKLVLLLVFSFVTILIRVSFCL